MSIFVYIFAAKLDTKNNINKQMEQIFNSLAPEGYFANLTKKEKGKFLRYLMVTYDLNYNTIRRKLSGVAAYQLNTLERMACTEAIKKEDLWRY